MYNRQGRGKVVSSLRCHIVTDDIPSAVIIWLAFVPLKARRTTKLNVLNLFISFHKIYLCVTYNF